MIIFFSYRSGWQLSESFICFIFLLLCGFLLWYHSGLSASVLLSYLTFSKRDPLSYWNMGRWHWIGVSTPLLIVLQHTLWNKLRFFWCPQYVSIFFISTEYPVTDYYPETEIPFFECKKFEVQFPNYHYTQKPLYWSTIDCDCRKNL